MLAERLKYTTDAAPIGVWDWNIKADIRHVMLMYFAMPGRDPDERLSPRKT